LLRTERRAPLLQNQQLSPLSEKTEESQAQRIVNQALCPSIHQESMPRSSQNNGHEQRETTFRSTPREEAEPLPPDALTPPDDIHVSCPICRILVRVFDIASHWDTHLSEVGQTRLPSLKGLSQKQDEHNTRHELPRPNTNLNCEPPNGNPVKQSFQPAAEPTVVPTIQTTFDKPESGENPAREGSSTASQSLWMLDLPFQFFRRFSEPLAHTQHSEKRCVAFLDALPLNTG
jgi:hypothetical protein